MEEDEATYRSGRAERTGDGRGHQLADPLGRDSEQGINENTGVAIVEDVEVVLPASHRVPLGAVDM